jgi:hypothetical protein
MGTHKTLLFALLLLALVALEAVVVWRPFNSRLIAYDSGLQHRKTVGQIEQGFHLVQTVPAKLFRTHLPAKRITHWRKGNARLYAGQPNCFALRFATYARTNTGHIAINWRQGTGHQRWTIDAAGLRNSAFADFCPTDGFDTQKSFQLGVSGIDSPHGRAATLWLARSTLAPASVNGKPIGKRGVALQLVRDEHIGPRRILGLDKGAFAFACLCSLGIGVLVIAASLRYRKPPTA